LLVRNARERLIQRYAPLPVLQPKIGNHCRRTSKGRRLA
jgi:hypothetical protein